MVTIRNDTRIKLLKKTSNWLTMGGMLILFAGLFIGWTPDTSKLIGLSEDQILLLPLLTLPLGVILSQIGIGMAHRYVRDPRPDEVLDKEIKRAATNNRWRTYHYVVPNLPHVLLSPAGLILLIPKYQRGFIRVDGDRWEQRFSETDSFLTRLWGWIRKLFGQENLGNPTQEAEARISILLRYFRKHLPELSEIPISAVIVFTLAERKQLDLQKSTMPAVHYTKLKALLQKQSGSQMAVKDYERIQWLLDKAAPWLSD